MSSSRDGESSHVLIVDPPHKDEHCVDVVVGDLHGNFDSLQSVAALLKSKDRIFIVGDLTDRGAGNIELIRTIVTNNQDDSLGKIYCVRGNHEDALLKAFNALQLFSEIYHLHRNDPEIIMCLKLLEMDPKMKDFVTNDNIQYFLKPMADQANDAYVNFLVAHKNFNVNTSAGEIVVAADLVDDYEALKSAVQDVAFHTHPVMGGDWFAKLYLKEFSEGKFEMTKEGAEFDEDSEVYMIQDYISSLPYIIYMADEKRPFLIVHADMPFDDDTLMNYLDGKTPLTQQQIRYATEKRFKTGESTTCSGRDENSISCYVGHSIDKGPRPDEAVANLDNGSYLTGSVLYVNHTQGVCGVTNYKAGTDPLLDDLLAATQAEVTRQRDVTADLQGSPQQQPLMSSINVTGTPATCFSEQKSAEVRRHSQAVDHENPPRNSSKPQ